MPVLFTFGGYFEVGVHSQDCIMWEVVEEYLPHLVL